MLKTGILFLVRFNLYNLRIFVIPLLYLPIREGERERERKRQRKEEKPEGEEED